MPHNELVIIGGGVAGLSAAVFAIRHQLRPIIIEATPNFGGRARSVALQALPQQIDNGQHVLSSAYSHTRELLDIIGTSRLIYFQPKLSINFFLNNRRKFQFIAAPLPAPFHFLVPLLLKAPLTETDRKHLWQFGKSFAFSKAEEFHHLTVAEWLETTACTDSMLKLLWEPITLATINTPVKKASAEMLHRVLKLAFLGNSKNSGLGIPKASLSEVFAKPAVQFIEQNGGEVISGNSVVKIEALENGHFEIYTNRNKTVKTSCIIAALPPYALSKIINNSAKLGEKLSLKLENFDYSPIITVYFWLKKAILSSSPTALIDSPIQWLFRLPAPPQGTGLHGYSAVISAASSYTDLSDNEILKILASELRHYFLVDIIESRLMDSYKIIREKKATFLQTPESLHNRPSTITPIKNLFLAGDWIDTGLPATIESAIVSAKAAINGIVKLLPLK
jgi:squalene-associated FAD-dependent desaturase